MANPRQILGRRRAAANISKVTHTMETISAVRYRKYYGKWYDGTEFYDALAQLAYLLVTAEQPVKNPLIEPNDSRDYAVIVLGSDRGLCGAYNSNLFKLVEVHSKMAKRFRRNLRFYIKGRKVQTHFQNRGIKVEKIYDEFDEVPTTAQARKIGDTFIEKYVNGEIGKLAVIYNRFFSAASQQAQTLTLLPLADLIDDLTTRSTIIWPWEEQFEDFMLLPSAEKIFESVSRMIINTVLMSCFLEAALSEHLSRVVAMRSATDNANEMINDLTREYNRARQGQITVDLLDIISGAEASQQ